MRTMLVVIEGKGGVAKSTLTALAILALRGDGKRLVEVLDGDTTNSSTMSCFPEAQLIDFSVPEAAGILAATLRSDADALVVDTGARDEARILDMMPMLAARAAKAKTALVQIRPITLSSFVQTNAVASVRRLAPLGVKTLLVPVLAQGRTRAHYADWHASTGRAEALKLGAIELEVTDAGVRWGDEAVAFRLTFGDIALGLFERVSGDDLRALAESIFHVGVQEHLGMWVEDNGTRLLDGLKSLGLKL